MRKVLIFSGLSGSGKTTLSNRFAGVTVSADDYMLNASGVYEFNFRRLPEAHARCFQVFMEHLRSGSHAVIGVANTNTTPEEVAPYFLGAKAYGYEPHIIMLEIGIDLAEQRNEHGVTYETLGKQRVRFERFKKLMPAQWRSHVLHGDPDGVAGILAAHLS
jgi:predicted kinase